MYLTPHLISVYRRRVCQCGKKCLLGVEYRDVSGEVEFTLCIGAAKNLALETFQVLMTQSHTPPPLKRFKTWTAKEEGVLRRRVAEGATQGQIGIEIGRTPSVVRKKIAHMKKTGKW